MKIKFDGEFKWNKSVSQMLAERNLETGGRVQETIDAAVIRECVGYVPYETGFLERSPNTETDVGSGEVKYPGPYAHYQYYGVVHDPGVPVLQGGEIVGFFSPVDIKSPSGKRLQYNTETRPNAGSFWFERMKADHADDILVKACEVAGAKPKK